ncbi:MAG: hypothetical protein K0S25_857 [Bacillus sp. (in: firmicutes)]|nr:hypothetical protein [Bacillus sp. (in: firmicutes)]
MLIGVEKAHRLPPEGKCLERKSLTESSKHVGIFVHILNKYFQQDTKRLNIYEKGNPIVFIFLDLCKIDLGEHFLS